MSRFTKRRKAARQEKEEKQRRLEENLKKSEKTCNDILKTCDYINKNHPEFDSLDGDKRVELFGEIFNKIHNEA